MKAGIVFAALVATLSFSALAESKSIEGVVRSVDPDEMRVVIVTGSGEIVAAWGSEATAVRFEGSTYRIRNLEVGDRVSMSVSGEGDEARVEAIDVLASVSPSERLTPRPGPEPEPEPSAEAPRELMEGTTTLTSVVGKIDQTRPDRNLIRIIADGGLSWVRIDATNAVGPDGTPVKVSDLKFGETIEATGKIGNNGELVATVIRRDSEIQGGMPAPAILPVDEPDMPADETAPVTIYRPREIRWLDVVEFAGEIVSPLDGTQTLRIRNAITGGDDVVWCDESLVALSDDDPVPASELEAGMHVEVRALRVSEGLVAQSIRVEED